MSDYDTIGELVTWATGCKSPFPVTVDLGGGLELRHVGKHEHYTPAGMNSWAVDIVGSLTVWRGNDMLAREFVPYGEDDRGVIEYAVDVVLRRSRQAVTA
jgi:hypothetical protein